MLLKTPAFWNKKIGILAILLTPLAPIYYALTKLVKIYKGLFCKQIKLSKPVICLGNIVFGGGGKTPACIFMANLLKQNGYSPVFLTRGYGRKSRGFFEVFESSNPTICGDEPVLLVKHAPVFVYSRPQDLLKINKGDIFIMDDGLQNNAIYKSITFLVQNATYKNGNGFIFPAGPLRCFAWDVKYNATLTITNETDKNSKQSELILQAKTNAFLYKNTTAFAFCGLAICDKFYTSLKNDGINLVKTLNFPDHHIYTEKDIKTIQNAFKPQNFTKHNFMEHNFINSSSLTQSSPHHIFTTEKDFIKIKTLTNTTNITPITLTLHTTPEVENQILNILRFAIPLQSRG